MLERAVFLDVDGVLVHGYHARPELQRRWDENLLEDLGIDPDRFRDEFIFDIFVRKVLVGQLPLVEALDRVLPGMGYKGSSLTLLTYWLSRDSNVNTPLIETIKTLRRSLASPFYIATNQDHARAQWLWQGLGFSEWFDDMFYAARLGVVKPEPAFFAAIEARVGPFTEPPLFFDDSPKVVEAANAFGWEAVQFDTTDDFVGHPFIAARLA
jgi:putative hydrolase of the HAD superfamily